MTIAIDGPAGSGKSTVAKAVAKKTGFIYIDTGSMYRALALKALEKKYDINKEEDIKELILTTKFSLENNSLLIDSKPISAKIRNKDVTDLSSQIAVNEDVRAFLVDEQRNIAKKNNVVMEGRDIGTVVLENSRNKFYLDASPEVRAKRRILQREEELSELNIKNTISKISERDKRDSSRRVGPLKVADDAIYIDTSNLSFEEVVKIIVERLVK